MVQKIVWTQRAQKDRREILQYWRERNKSNIYSVKLNQLFIEHIKIISVYPNVGISTTDENVRVKIIKDYLLFYELRYNIIYKLTIWDSRRDPDQLKIV